MEIIDQRSTAQYVSTLDIPQAPPIDNAVDATVKFPLQETTGPDNRTKVHINGAEGLPIPIQNNNVRDISLSSNGLQMPKHIYPVYPINTRTGDIARYLGGIFHLYFDVRVATGEEILENQEKSGKKIWVKSGHFYRLFFEKNLSSNWTLEVLHHFSSFLLKHNSF